MCTGLGVLDDWKLWHLDWKIPSLLPIPSLVVLAGGFSKTLVPLVSKVHKFSLKHTQTYYNKLICCSPFWVLWIVTMESLKSKFWLQEMPKALLPVANRPVLSYVLELLEQNNLKDLIVVWFLFHSMCFVIYNWGIQDVKVKFSFFLLSLI